MDKSQPDKKYAENWDEYYDTYPVPEWLAKRMWHEFKTVLQPHVPDHHLTVVELGGADSDILHRFEKSFSVNQYHVVDNNEAGLKRFHKRYGNGVGVAHLKDLVEESPPDLQADLAISGGLIEHFEPTGTTSMIQRHFDCVRPGGLVLMSFPRSTVPYWLTRKLATRLGLFSADHYERPLDPGEIRPVLQKHGEVLAYTTIWSIGLTQSVTLTRKAV
jgi:hypothetical protein